MAGPAVDDAILAARASARAGHGCTICYWDRRGSEPATVSVTARDGAASVAASDLVAVIAVKAPPIAFDPQALAAILTAAAGLPLVLDAQHETDAARTFELLERVTSPAVDLGCALPARWRRSGEDAERAISAGWSIRLVKGQFPGADPAVDPASMMRELATQVAGRARRVGVATHDPALAADCLEALLMQDTACELELLYGMPMRLPLAVAHRLGVPVRIYVPYGQRQPPYALNEIDRRPRVAWWLARDMVRSRVRQRG